MTPKQSMRISELDKKVSDLRSDLNDLEFRLKDQIEFSPTVLDHRRQNILKEEGLAPFSPRASNVLLSAGILTWSNLARQSRRSMIRLRSCGQTTLSEFTERLAERGLCFATHEEDPL